MTFRRLLGIADAGAITLAVVAAVLLAGDGHLTWVSLAVVPLFVLVAKLLGLYDRDEHLLHKNTLDELPRLLNLATASALLMFFSGEVLVEGQLGRSQIAILWGSLVLLLLVLRAVARGVARRLTETERCIYLGDRQSADEIREKLNGSSAVKAELVGWIPLEADDHLEGGLNQRAGLIAHLRAQVEELDVDRIILGPGPNGSEDLLDAVRRMRDSSIKVSILSNASRIVTPSIALDRLEGITLLGLPRFRITKSSRLVKRSFDIAVSGALLVLASPITLLIAIAIKLDSPGPVIFRQRRAGRHGEPFEMLKFRSMVDGADQRKDALRHLNEADGLFKIASDPRITRVGRVIRGRYLDELPQLVNVLRGDMSLVGPRPLALDEDKTIEGWHRRRLELRPGITGPWQVLDSARIPLSEMVKIDYQYTADWSLWTDLRILTLTAGHVARSGGL